MANQPAILFQSLTTSSTGSDGKLLTFPLFSEKTKGCGYRGQANPVHTVSYATTSGFNGVLKLQGSLVATPGDTDWYDILGTTLGDGITPVIDQTVLINFNGQHVWIRAVIVSFIAGQVNSVLLTHN